MKLYHYVHCPFCVRVRLALGFIKQEFDSIVVPYHDERTPINLTGIKMLPIMEFSDGAINESLDIILKIDKHNQLKNEMYLNHKDEIEALLSKIGGDVHSLAMPYWIWTPEFNNESRKYFQSKKEIKRGPFSELVKNRNQFIENLNQTLKAIESKLEPFYQSNELTILDIMIASHLWGLYIVPEFQFQTPIHNYLMRIKDLCQFDYHKDFWNN